MQEPRGIVRLAATGTSSVLAMLLASTALLSAVRHAAAIDNAVRLTLVYMLLDASQP